MAKRVRSLSLKGVYEHATGEVTEMSKDEIDVFSLKDLLKEFDGYEISISVREEQKLESNE